MQGKDERHGKLSIQSENGNQGGAEGYRAEMNVMESSVYRVRMKGRAELKGAE